MSEPKRDRFGRYLLPDPVTGKERAWTRATTVSGALSDRYNLELWSKRMVVLGMGQSKNLQETARIARLDDKAALNAIAEEALEVAKFDERAKIGTEIHEATENFDRGKSLTEQSKWFNEVRVYAAKLESLDITVVPGWIERIVLVPELGVAGTLDRLLKCDAWDLPRIADLKTGSVGPFNSLEHAIQQAIYANATHFYDPDLDQLVEVPAIDKKAALIIHLPAGKARCEIHELNIEAGWDAAKLAVEVRKWRNRKDLSKTLVEIGGTS